MNRRAVALLVLAIVLRPLPSLTAATDADEIARHIKQLGSDDYDERETASNALASIGDPALPALRDATKSTDAEVKRRAGELVSLLNGRAADRARGPFFALVAKVGGRITILGWEADERQAVCVDLAGTSVTDADVKQLGKWSELRELDLSGTNITDDTLACLRSATGLRQLKVDEVVGQKARITAKAVAELRKSLPNLDVTMPSPAIQLGDFRPAMFGDE